MLLIRKQNFILNMREDVGQVSDFDSKFKIW